MRGVAFSYMGKSIDKRFAELGAQRFYDMCKDTNQRHERFLYSC